MHPVNTGSHHGGFRLGRYRVAHQIGEGGSGVVYVALDESGKAYAIKVLRPHVASEPVARERLAREVATLARVHHPSIAQVVEADTLGNPPYIVTQYVPAPSLHDVVRQHGPLDDDGLIRLGNGIGQALAHIHSLGVVHRDLKPANVLIDGGEPVLIDFGIAHLADLGRLTQAGMVMGTPGYVAPEILLGNPVDGSTDWWSWAALMAFAATGRPPFGEGPMEAVLDRVRRGQADLRGAPGALIDVLSRGLSPEPAHRPHPSQFRVALMDLQQRRRERPQPSVLDLAAHEQTQRLAQEPSFAGEQRQPPAQLPGVEQPAAATAWNTPALGIAVHPAAPTQALPQVSRAASPATAPLPQVSAPANQPAAPVRTQPMPSAPVNTTPLPSGPSYRPAPQGPPAGVQTMPMPAPPPPAAPAVPQVEPPADPVQYPRTPRSGSLFALGAALATMAGVAPIMAVILGFGIATLARTVDVANQTLLRRRDERGRSRSDGLVVALGSPLHLVSSAIRSAGLMVVPLLIGCAITYLSSLMLGTGPAVSNFRLHALPLMIGAASAITLAWWGPGGGSLRRGTRTMVRSIAPPPNGAQVFSSLLGLCSLAALIIAWRSSNGDIDWFPLSAHTFSWLMR